jgi:hypothetical protein
MRARKATSRIAVVLFCLALASEAAAKPRGVFPIPREKLADGPQVTVRIGGWLRGLKRTARPLQGDPQRNQFQIINHTHFHSMLGVGPWNGRTRKFFVEFELPGWLHCIGFESDGVTVKAVELQRYYGRESVNDAAIDLIHHSQLVLPHEQVALYESIIDQQVFPDRWPVPEISLKLVSDNSGQMLRLLRRIPAGHEFRSAKGWLSPSIVIANETPIAGATRELFQ